MLLFSVDWAFSADSTCGTNGVNDSCTPAGLQTLIDDAGTVAGDTITIATGTHTFNTAAVITKTITISGGGNCTDCGDNGAPTGTWPTTLNKENTATEPSLVIKVPSSPTPVGHARITGIRFTGFTEQNYNCGPDDEGGPAVHTLTAFQNFAQFRIDNNNYYDDIAVNTSGFVMADANHDNASGVFDNNWFHSLECVGDGDNAFMAQVQKCNDFFTSPGGGWSGDISWADPLDLGGVANTWVVFEDNTFDYDEGETSCLGNAFLVDVRKGGKGIWRHNHIEVGGWSMHGARGSESRSGRAMIIHDNVVSRGDFSRNITSFRGGSYWVWNNSFNVGATAGNRHRAAARVWGFRPGDPAEGGLWNGCIGNSFVDGNGAIDATASGTATSGSSTTLADTSKSWTTNEWVDDYVHNTSEEDAEGTGSVDCISQVTSNTATTLTFAALGPSCSGNGAFDASEGYKISNGYPCIDGHGFASSSPGIGDDNRRPQAVTPMRWWNNTDATEADCGGTLQPTGDFCIDTEIGPYFQQDRDWTHCADDTCPWVSTFLSGYTEIAYPHPLRQEAVAVGSAMSGVSLSGGTLR